MSAGKVLDNPRNWILVRLRHQELLLPRYLYYLLQHFWHRGAFAQIARGTTSRQCIRVSDVGAISFAASVGTIELRQLALVKTLSPSSRLQPEDIALRRCSGTLQLVGEPVFVSAG